MQVETANDKFMISEFMSFVCTNSCENGITEEKVLAKCSGKAPFFKVSRVPKLFQSVKCLYELVEQYVGRKRGGREAEFHERIRKE